MDVTVSQRVDRSMHSQPNGRGFDSWVGARMRNDSWPIVDVDVPQSPTSIIWYQS